MNLKKRVLYKLNPTFRNSERIRKTVDRIEVELAQINERSVQEAEQTHTRLETLQSILKEFESRELRANRLSVLEKAHGDGYFDDLLTMCEAVMEPPQSPEQNKLTRADYLAMQKKHYEDTSVPSKAIVGQYEWHENYPYETHLLYRFGDVRHPIFPEFGDKKALDVGCGPGRMVRRMSAILGQVDGCDIAQRLLDEARQLNPNSNFYLTKGDDLGNAPKEYYDLIYCTISLQHIASHSIRTSIIERICDCLSEKGCVTLQMAYSRDFPFVDSQEFFMNDKKVVVKKKANQAPYASDAFDATETNGGFDVGIGPNDLEDVKRDFAKNFSDVEVWFGDVRNYYENLRGAKHTTYWADSWIYIHGKKKPL